MSAAAGERGPKPNPGPVGSRRPVFVLSMARSGSTLLRLTLGKLPGLVALPETHFWVFRERHAGRDLGRADERRRVADAWIAYHRIVKWPIDHARLRADVAEGGVTWRRVLEITAERYVADSGADPALDLVWLEKSPPHVFRRAAILRDFPEARFLQLVRDPRDVSASLKSCPWATANVYTSARVWRAAARRIREDADTLLVHYESFVADSSAQAARICSFLGIDFHAERLAAPTSDVVEERNVRSAASLGPASAEFIGIWRKRLSVPDRDLEVVQHVCREAMRELGYAPEEAIRRDLRFRVRLLLGWVGLLAERLLR